MPRSPRLDLPGARHHVMNRVADRRAAFRDLDDLTRFQAALSELPGRFDARVHAFALMGNHFHLLLETPRGNLSQAMAWFSGTWVRATNRAHGTEGTLFRSRYRNRVVLDDGWWRRLLFYVHLNPVAARLVKHPDGSTWTSHRAYAGLDPAPSWLHRRELLELVGGRAGYLAALDEALAEERRSPTEIDWNAALPVNTSPVRAATVPAAVSTQPAADAVSQVRALTGSDDADLLRGARGRTGNAARALLAWWLVRSAGQSRAEVAERLAMSPGAVGSAVHRVAHATDELGAWRDQLVRDWTGGERVERRPKKGMETS